MQSESGQTIAIVIAGAVIAVVLLCCLAAGAMFFFFGLMGPTVGTVYSNIVIFTPTP